MAGPMVQQMKQLGINAKLHGRRRRMLGRMAQARPAAPPKASTAPQAGVPPENMATSPRIS